MSDAPAEAAVTAAAAPETSPAVAPAAPAGSTPPAKPEWLGDDPHGFWDGEAGTVKADAMYQSLQATKKLIGARISDMPLEARRKLAEVLPDELKATVAESTKAELLANEEFLKPLRDAWLAEAMPKAPEAYAAPEGLDIDTEHPGYTAAIEIAKSHGLPQEAFDKLVNIGVQMLTPYEGPVTFDHLAEAIGPDVAARANAVANRVRSLVPQGADDLLRAMAKPEAFLALERLVTSTSEQPLTLDAGAGPSGWTAESLQAAIKDPRYWRTRDPAFIAQVTAGFQKVHASDRV